MTNTTTALLNLMMEDMNDAPAVFRPTKYWKTASKHILEDIKTAGIENFQSHKSASKYYVPSYSENLSGQEMNCFSLIEENFVQFALSNDIDPSRAAHCKTLYQYFIKGFLEGHIKGYMHYNTFLAADTSKAPHLSNISQSSIGNPHELFTFHGKKYSRVFLNYLRALAFLKKHVSDTDTIKTILEIGGGYGTLGEIMLQSNHDCFYINIDIPPLSYVSTYYLQQVFGQDAIADYSTTRDMEIIDIDILKEKYRGAVLCPWQLPRIKGNFDLFANFISFQEMEPAIVENYASYLNRIISKYMLLRNSSTGKPSSSSSNNKPCVDTPVVRQHYLDFFEPFSLIAADSKIFGDQHQGLDSEVLILGR